MIISPRQRFCESAHRSSHEKLVITEAFQIACEYALLTLVSELPEASDPSRGWDSHSQLTGARRVLDILKTLHKLPEKPKGLKSPTLKYGV